MATLQKIRNHGVALLIIVGLAMLAFILGDFLNSGSSFFNRSREYVAEIAGHKVHYTDYEAAKDQLTEVYKIESGRTDFDEDQTNQIRNQVWQMMLADYTLQEQTREIGMDVTTEELSELCIGENPHQLIRQRRVFTDENGQFSREAVIRFHSQVFGASDDVDQANLKQAKSYWLYWENAVRLTQMQEKYTSLIQHLLKANKLDAKYAFNARQESVNVQYAMQPYASIADSLVKVSTRDLKEIYNERKPLYKQTPNRALEYISFAIVPSEDDYKNVEKLMNDLKEEFATTDDIMLVVNTNSDRMYDGTNYSAETVPAQYKDFAFGKDAKKDAVTEIRFADDTYSMARIMECGYSLPDSVELKLIAQAEGQEDQELGWFTEAQLQKQISEPAFAGKKGTRFTVAAGLGEQTFEVMNVAKATPKVKLAILERKVTPSSKTYSVLYNEAKQFIITNNTEDMFRAAASEKGLALQPAYNLDKNTDKIGQLRQSRPIVRWAFEAKEEGAISDVFECGDQFIVAVLTDINEDEYRPLESVQGELRVSAMNRKKAEMIKKELKDVTTLEAAAEKMNTTIEHADNVSLSSYQFGRMGVEPAVIGTAMATPANQISEAVAGNTGVFMLIPSEKTVAEGTFDEESEIRQASSRYMYLAYQAVRMIEDKAEVEDNRANFQ